VIAAADLLETDWDVAAEVFSATSFSELDREARAVERWNRLHPEAEPRTSHLAACLPGRAPVIAATDYVRAYPQLIAPYVEGRFVALGTDGFGRSDTRAKLRSFFEVDHPQIVLAALAALAAEGRLDRKIMAAAIRRYGIDPERPASWTC
jgi:pyruvate dehydrogenase E1 component